MTRHGAVPHWLYLITEGEAKVLIDGPQGWVQVNTLRSGDVFGEMSCSRASRAGPRWSQTARVDCYRLDKAGFAQVLRDRPELAAEVAAIAERRNAQSAARLQHARLPQSAHGNLLARILSFFSLPA